MRLLPFAVICMTSAVLLAVSFSVRREAAAQSWAEPSYVETNASGTFTVRAGQQPVGYSDPSGQIFGARGDALSAQSSGAVFSDGGIATSSAKAVMGHLGIHASVTRQTQPSGAGQQGMPWGTGSAGATATMSDFGAIEGTPGLYAFKNFKFCVDAQSNDAGWGKILIGAKWFVRPATGGPFATTTVIDRTILVGHDLRNTFSGPIKNQECYDIEGKLPVGSHFQLSIQFEGAAEVAFPQPGVAGSTQSSIHADKSVSVQIFNATPRMPDPTIDPNAQIVWQSGFDYARVQDLPATPTTRLPPSAASGGRSLPKVENGVIGGRPAGSVTSTKESRASRINGGDSRLSFSCGKEGSPPCGAANPVCDANLVLRSSSPQICEHPACGRLDDNACTVTVRVPSCDGTLVEVGGRCKARGACGSEGARACQIVERIPSCDANLVEHNGSCTHPSCGREGARACSIFERVPSCDTGLRESIGRCVRP